MSAVRKQPPGCDTAGCERPRPRLLVVGQTPPPLHGQAVIERLAQAHFDKVELADFSMGFSDEVAEVRQVQAKKLWHLLELILEVALARAHGPSQ